MEDSTNHELRITGPCILGRLRERSRGLHERLAIARELDHEAQVGLYQVQLLENTHASMLVMRATKGHLICEGVQGSVCSIHARMFPAEGNSGNLRHALWGRLRTRYPHLAKNLDALSSSALHELADILSRSAPSSSP